MCPNCKFLDIKDSKDGKVSGKMYYCKKNKCYCYQCGMCDSYEKDLKRSKDDISEVTYYLNECDNMTIGSGIAFLVLITLIFILTKII